MGTILTWLALILGAGALIYSWLLQQELARATRRLDRYNRALYDANDEIRRLREELADNVAQLRVEAMQQTPQMPAFTPQMPAFTPQMPAFTPQMPAFMPQMPAFTPQMPAFTPQMTVSEAMAVHPQTEQLLASFHLGGCSSCAVEPDETLAQICRNSGRDLTELLVNLNQLLAFQTTNGDQPLQRVKIPNVEFSLPS